MTVRDYDGYQIISYLLDVCKTDNLKPCTLEVSGTTEALCFDCNSEHDSMSLNLLLA